MESITYFTVYFIKYLLNTVYFGSLEENSEFFSGFWRTPVINLFLVQYSQRSCFHHVAFLPHLKSTLYNYTIAGWSVDGRICGVLCRKRTWHCCGDRLWLVPLTHRTVRAQMSPRDSHNYSRSITNRRQDPLIYTLFHSLAFQAALFNELFDMNDSTESVSGVMTTTKPTEQGLLLWPGHSY